MNAFVSMLIFAILLGIAPYGTFSFVPTSYNAFIWNKSRALSSSCWEKPKWLGEAMNNDDSGDEEYNDDRVSKVPTLSNGLAGFSLDPDVGFVAILSSATKFVAAIVSPQDQGNDRLTSPEALTMVQLAGGLDLGTAILPPDALLQMVLISEEEDEEEEEEELDEEGEEQENATIPLVTLTGVRVVPNGDVDSQETIGKKDKILSQQENTMNSIFDEERDEAIQKGILQVCKAVQTLPGLEQVTLEQVEVAMNLHANEQGVVDRQAFSGILDFLRRNLNTSANVKNKVKFVLDVNVVRRDCIKPMSIETSDTFRALGLAMRHKMNVVVDPECLEKEASEILNLYPGFRPMEELLEDAKIMDGFIPSMYEKAKRQQEESPPEEGS